MQIFPAIDLRGGQVVRLYQGDYDQETVYGADPRAQARAFLEAGAQCLPVVDLDGARDGTMANFDSIAAIAKQGGLYIEVGGGIRTEERVRRYLDLGVGRCILGTIAVKDFDFTARMAQTYGDQIAVGVDARDGYVAVNGWKELSREKGVDFCRRLRDAGVRTVIYTDISRDGAGRGPTWSSTRSWSKSRAWMSPPPAASAPWRSCGGWRKWESAGPSWARPCTTGGWTCGPSWRRWGRVSQADHPLPGRAGRTGGEGDQLRRAPGHGGPGGAGPVLQRLRGRRAGVL